MAALPTQVKTEATDGYSAVQVGYKVVKEKKITKAELCHLKKSGAPPMKKLREYRVCSPLPKHFLLFKGFSSVIILLLVS
jgi:ribosomal protein L3